MESCRDMSSSSAHKDLVLIPAVQSETFESLDGSASYILELGQVRNSPLLRRQGWSLGETHACAENLSGPAARWLPHTVLEGICLMAFPGHTNALFSMPACPGTCFSLQRNGGLLGQDPCATPRLLALCPGSQLYGW